MSSPTQVQWRTGYGDAVGTPTGINSFQTGDYIYDKREYTQTAGQNAPFKYNPKLVLYGLQLTNGSGDIQGDGVAADGTPDTATSGWWYICQEYVTGNRVILHEQNCNTLAQIDTLVGTEVGDWTDPA